MEHPDRTPRAHRVMRQDDNGNRFLLARGLTRPAAEALAAEFEARGHKQLYWVEPEEPEAPEPPEELEASREPEGSGEPGRPAQSEGNRAQ